MNLDVERIRAELTRALLSLPEKSTVRPMSLRFRAKAVAHTQIALLLLNGSQPGRIVGGPKE